MNRKKKVNGQFVQHKFWPTSYAGRNFPMGHGFSKSSSTVYIYRYNYISGDGRVFDFSIGARCTTVENGRPKNKTNLCPLHATFNSPTLAVISRSDMFVHLADKTAVPRQCDFMLARLFSKTWKKKENLRLLLDGPTCWTDLIIDKKHTILLAHFSPPSKKYPHGYTPANIYVTSGRRAPKPQDGHSSGHQIHTDLIYSGAFKKWTKGVVCWNLRWDAGFSLTPCPRIRRRRRRRL